MESSSVAPTTFTIFPRLSTELRLHIWGECLPKHSGRLLFFNREGCWNPLREGPNMTNRGFRSFCEDDVERTQVELSVAHVNREARGVALAWALQEGFEVLLHPEPIHPSVPSPRSRQRSGLGRRGPIFTRPFDLSRDVLYVGEDDWDDWAKRSYRPILASPSVTTSPPLKWLAMSEELFCSDMERTGALFGWFLKVGTMSMTSKSTLFIVRGAPPEPRIHDDRGSPPPRWELAKAVEAEARFVWSAEAGEFEFTWGRLEDENMQGRWVWLLEWLGAGLPEHQGPPIEIVLVRAGEV